MVVDSGTEDLDRIGAAAVMELTAETGYASIAEDADPVRIARR
jgi:hypothetical protein